ncbi:Esterase FE4 [Cryptotermes secundus]|uniref:Carboxylic ester hydrolase n=1 Tax=Cryptotermes secundus TaxID=105785 RepID=A0A2J7RMS4_9NEOP|nr:Esterase FE4 [Cryptotermes secundus]PNF42128.1 Esterase FE4 [Cryptotermes secundus]
MAGQRLPIAVLVFVGTCSLLVSVTQSSVKPVVKVQQGLIQGKILTSARSKNRFAGFLGIPYAKPPVGDLKFKAPEAPASWTGTRHATTEGSICAQRNELTRLLLGEDDCLFLNVFTPKLPDDNEDSLKPVMVFIHGGAFYFGSSSSRTYGADYLVEQGVVLVTINYRLGAQGFLSLENEEVPGNAGLKDQVMALRWVQQNIVQFGGDPGNVTLFGQSAGGVSVQYHMLSPMSKGLFHRAIAESGSVLNFWAFTNSSRRMAFRLGEKLGIRTDDPQELLNHLRSVDTLVLTKVSHEVLTPEEKPMSIGFPFLPTTDTASGGEVFLPAPPRELLDSGTLSTVPMIAGVTSHEGILALNVLKEHPESLDILDKEFERAIPEDFPVVRNTNKSQEISHKIRKFYFGNKRVSEETLLQFVNMITDVWFIKDINMAVKKIAAISTSPVYYYEFSFDGPFGIIKRIWGAENLPGAAHADELGYLFHMLLTSRIVLKPEHPAVVTQSRMVKLWTNFAKSGNPTPEEDPLLNVTWPSYTTEDPTYLNIDRELSLRNNLNKERLQFWEDLYKSVLL